MPKTSKIGRFRRVALAITRLFRRGRHAQTTTLDQDASVRHARPAHRQTDIPMDQLEDVYIPTQTSLKGPFRASGADQQRDQEFAHGTADDRWKDEDLITNKSGDPRIGTHGRTYEPGEKRDRG
ncbi:MAG TPA: hypothetical protein VLU46_06490 [Thermoanaerobaculia bacterium]|nr:hypothetical protein [Thermoanaerobaculia bacterium]